MDSQIEHAAAGRGVFELRPPQGLGPGLWLGLGALLVLLPLVFWGLSLTRAIGRDSLLSMALAATAGAGLVLLLCGLMLFHEKRVRTANLTRHVGEQVEKALAKRTLDERSRLLSAVAHDLRQPLYAMSLATQSLARQRYPRHPDALLAQLRNALESVDTLLDTIDTVALLETGAMQPRLSVFSVQVMLERIDRLYGPQARARGLHWTVTPSLEVAHTDAVLLERMLGHLVSNAVRCTPLGGVLVSCRRRGRHLLFQVWDTGPGMNETELATVFELHFRGQARTETDNGVGLGLSIVHHAARLLDIGLGVRSRVGHGTCFSLRVPRGEAAAPVQLAA